AEGTRPSRIDSAVAPNTARVSEKKRSHRKSSSYGQPTRNRPTNAISRTACTTHVLHRLNDALGVLDSNPLGYKLRKMKI
ncbi:hypothetical protein THAOC_35340, partial [Thalassiosira oceanica]